MALRKLAGLPLPAPPEQAEGSLVEQILAIPQLGAARLLLESFRDMRPWWPVLVPVLLWVGIRTYRKERAALLSAPPEAA